MLYRVHFTTVEDQFSNLSVICMSRCYRNDVVVGDYLVDYHEFAFSVLYATIHVREFMCVCSCINSTDVNKSVKWR